MSSPEQETSSPASSSPLSSSHHHLPLHAPTSFPPHLANLDYKATSPSNSHFHHRHQQQHNYHHHHHHFVPNQPHLYYSKNHFIESSEQYPSTQTEIVPRSSFYSPSIQHRAAILSTCYDFPGTFILSQNYETYLI